MSTLLLNFNMFCGKDIHLYNLNLSWLLTIARELSVQLRGFYTQKLLYKTKDNSESDSGTCELIWAKHKIQTRWSRCKKFRRKAHPFIAWRWIRNQVHQQCHEYLKLSCYGITEPRGKNPHVFQTDCIKNLFLNKRKNKTMILNKHGILYTCGSTQLYISHF